jgi:hypothetical protein
MLISCSTFQSTETPTASSLALPSPLVKPCVGDCAISKQFLFRMLRRGMNANLIAPLKRNRAAASRVESDLQGGIA